MSHVVVARFWIDSRSEHAFRRREAALQPIMHRHGGSLVYEFSPDGAPGPSPQPPSVVHVLEFPDASSFGEYLRDRDRLAISASGDGAPVRVEIIAGAAS